MGQPWVGVVVREVALRIAQCVVLALMLPLLPLVLLGLGLLANMQGRAHASL